MIRHAGKLKWFNFEKGYGFISPNSGGPDIFVHISAFQRAGLDVPAEGTAISYESETRKGKPTAAAIELE